MFLLKKLISPFLMPPGLLVAACFAAALWALRARKERLPGLFAAAGLAVWFFSAPAFQSLLLRPLEHRYPQPQDLSADAIVVLGGSLVPGASDPGGAALDRDSSIRLLAALRLHRRTGLPVVVSGGGYLGSGSWAPAAARALEEAGVPADRIIEDGEARDTCENARFSAAIFARNGWSKALLVTSAVHMPRSVRSFRSAGFEAVTPVPCGYMTGRGWRGWTSLLPHGGSGWRPALHEYLGMAWYRAACPAVPWPARPPALTPGL